MKNIIKNLINKIYNREEPPKITWWTKPEYNGLIYVAPPFSATKQFPKILKNMPRDNPRIGFPTAKQCPAFIDLYKHTYILPMWCDVNLRASPTNTEALELQWETPTKEFVVTSHGNNQFLDFIPKSKQDWKFIWKLHCPWNLKTPKGYSVLQLPMTYEFNTDFEIMSGVIDTDIHHEINQQMIQKRLGTIEIKRGTPLSMYLPFKRDKFNLEIVLETQELWKSRIKDYWNILSKFGSNKSQLGGYKEIQKENTNKVL